MIQLHIIFNLKPGISGGGNQFLKALKEFFVRRSLYADNPDKANIFLFNSYQYIETVVELKKRFPKIPCVHRVDGPIRLYNKMSDRRDKITNLTNDLIADATVFQSSWSREANYSLGLRCKQQEIIIYNAPDPNIFWLREQKPLDRSKKIKIISSSWSENWNKGFETYKWLDENLNFDKYEMIFVGRTPIKFKKIIEIPPLKSSELADLLRGSDIYISASRKDPCSNSLIEALHCGLPALVLNDGGHPELVKNGGLSFNTASEIPSLLNTIVQEYDAFVSRINAPTLEIVGSQYQSFLENVLTNSYTLHNKIKSLSTHDYLKVKALLASVKWAEKFKGVACQYKAFKKK